MRNVVLPVFRMPALWLLCVLPCVTSAAQEVAHANGNPLDPGIKDEKQFDPRRPLETTFQGQVADGFTLAAVGDCIIARPVSQDAARDSGFAAVLKLLQGADAVYGNLEVSLVDPSASRISPNPGPGDIAMAAAPGVAKDLKAMGFDLLSRANNHAAAHLIQILTCRIHRQTQSVAGDVGALRNAVADRGRRGSHSARRRELTLPVPGDHGHRGRRFTGLGIAPRCAAT